ncbi:MAG TPA: DUF1761 domain-containing protein [Candidatus Kapabacteria bacterium]|nr:DUF1761 domain-containing protein [Candidatus Kapabacteria bacterium]
MDINLWAVLACAVLSMVVGSIWYGPLFGKKWLEVIGATAMDMEKRKEMQKKAMPLYGIQFLLSLFQAYVLAHYIAGWQDASGVENALWIWAAFILPTVAGASMWNNDSARISWMRFSLQTGYYLVLFVLFGLILSMWR